MNQELLTCLYEEKEAASRQLITEIVASIATQDHLLEAVDEAMQLQHSGFVSAARFYYQQLQQHYPNDEFLVALAELATDEGDYDEALDLLLQIEAHSSAYVPALLALADVYLILDVPEASEQKLLEAKRLLPDETVIDVALAEYYFAIGSYQQARIAYEALQHQSQQVLTEQRLQQRLAHCYSAQGDWEQAVALLKKDRLAYQHSDSLYQLGIGLMQLHEWEQAAAVFRDLLNMDPDYVTAFRSLAECLQHLGDYQGATEVLQEGQAANPYDVSLIILLAQQHMQQKQYDAARNLLAQAEELEPDNTRIQVHYAAVLLEQERFDEVEQYVRERVESQEVVDPQFYWQLAVAANELAHDAVAETYFILAESYYHDDLDFLKDYAQYLQAIGDQERWGQVIHQALACDPTDETVQMWHDAWHQQLMDDQFY